MLTLTKGVAGFKKLAATVTAAMSAKLPSFYEVKSIEAKGISLKGLKPDANGRYDLNLNGVSVRAGFFKGVPRDLEQYDLAYCKNVNPFTVDIGGSPVTYNAGEAQAFKLIQPGAKAAAKKEGEEGQE